MRRKNTAVKLLAPRQKNLMPDRPMPLPPPMTNTREMVSLDEWDILVLCILTDWNWLLTFEQLLVVIKREGSSYGFSVSNWASDRIEIEVGRSVKRLEAAKQLKIGKDRNTLSPIKTSKQPAVVKTQVAPKPSILTESQPQPVDERVEIRDKDDWQMVVLEVIEQADGSITQSDILDKAWRNDLIDWHLPLEISEQEVEKNIGLAIVALSETKIIVIDSDAGDYSGSEEIYWQLA